MRLQVGVYGSNIGQKLTETLAGIQKLVNTWAFTLPLALARLRLWLSRR